MEPNRHFEYQTHQQFHHTVQHHHIHAHPQHVVPSNYMHSTQQQQSTATVTLPPQQHHAQLHPQQSKGNAFNIASSINYQNISSGGMESSRNAVYVMSSCGSLGKGGEAESSVKQPVGTATSASGDDPHLQYYTSNRELTVSKRSADPTPSQIHWQYTTAQENKSTKAAPPPILTTHQAIVPCTTHWLSEDEQQHQPQHLLHQQEQHQRYEYSIAVNSSRNGSGQHYCEHNIKFSNGVPTSKVLEHATVAGGSSFSQQLVNCPEHYKPSDHVVNPTNALLSTSVQHPSPNYARKCPQHYDPPTEPYSASAPVPPAANNHQLQVTNQHQLQKQHQSLYMPPNFQNTMHNAIEKYVRESGPSPSLHFRLSANGLRSTVSFNEKAGGSKSNSNAYEKLESETSALSLPSLYHNPYNLTTEPPPISDKEQQQTRAIINSSQDSPPTPPKVFPTKYGKLLKQQHAALTQTIPQHIQSSAALHECSSSFHTSYDHQRTPSPAAAQMASPTLAQQLYNHTPPPKSRTVSNSNYLALHVNAHGPDLRCQPASATSVSVLPPASKKANQIMKPNYRALINDMLKRNTTSEEELNLQIIKKTLNMETPSTYLTFTPTTNRQQLAIANQAALTTPAPVIQQRMTRPLPMTLPNQHPTNSPLDLSMRTVKQTADSTNYKYQRFAGESKTTEPAQCITETGLGLSLPRFDITPNFARSNNSSKSETYTAVSTAVIRQARDSSGAAANAAPQNTTPMLIKAAQQRRPSVLESNPFAKHPVLPVETSIKHIKTAPDPSSSYIITPTNNTSAHNTTDPNYLGRKRHLQEYNLATAAAAAAALAEKQTQPAASQLDAGVIPVLNKPSNEEVLPAKQLELTATLNQGHNVGCQHKLALVVPKVEARIRTKAELKGFTFTPSALEPESLITANMPPILLSSEPVSTSDSVDELSQVLQHSQSTSSPQIKLEVSPTPALNQDIGLHNSSSRFYINNLLDWDSTCNNLVEQLLGRVMPVRSTSPFQTAALTKNSVAAHAVSLPLMSSSIKLELSEDDLPVARILKRQPKQMDAESAATTTTQVTNTTTTNSIGLICVQKKLSKTERDRKRIVQEQRIAARLAPAAGQSSSESDNTELHKRKTARQKKQLTRKGRGTMRMAEKIKEQLKQQKKESSEDPQEQDGETTSTETKAFKSVKKPRRSTANENIAQYTSGKCKAVKAQNHKQEKIEDQDEEESNASGCKKDSRQQQLQKKDDDDNIKMKNQTADVKFATKVSKINSKQTQATVLRTSAQSKNRIALNTMTRSKRKRELELQLANSKVLRNEKIIRNSNTKIKRKYVRKLEPDGKKELTNTRLRNKRTVDMTQLNGRKIKSNLETSPTNKNSYNKPNTSPHQQLILEEYRYKLALKIPQRLISMNKLQKLPQMAASLPDLERSCNYNQQLTCFKKTCGRKPRAKQTQQHYQLPKEKQQQQQKAIPKSIIDVLHRRVTSNSSKSGDINKESPQPSNCFTSLHNFSETSQTSASNSTCELQSLEADHTLVDITSKRHFSIFDTKVLQSKTRTESKLQQRREVIREIFVGTDRPASAPPECAQNHGGKECSALSYQQYEDFLEQMNRIVTANNNKLARHVITNDVANNIEKTEPFNTTASKLTTANCPHKRKYLRRKRSSGFDYIRKKKRPTQPQSASTGATSNIMSSSEQASPMITTAAVWSSTAADSAAADERLDDTDSTIAGSLSHLPIKIKSEMDVCREIQKWVLNKGVGQSTMHKAARQGLIDVVVYCLDRLGMNPDQKDNAGYTPLHEACTQGWLEIARILLQFGANHSEAAQSGIRPLHGAIENDHDEVVRLLLSYGADPMLATYSGQTPLMLASSKLMCSILLSHLSDAQSADAIKPMRFQGPWQIFNEKENGFNIFDGVPKTACDMSRAQCRQNRSVDRNLCDNRTLTKPKTTRNNTNYPNRTLQTTQESKETLGPIGDLYGKTATTLEDKNNNNKDNNIKKNFTIAVNGMNEVQNENNLENIETEEQDDESDIEETLSDKLYSDIFKFEEADVPLPPLYMLKDEGSDKWILLNDLCNLLRVKSKETLLNKICSNDNTPATTQKQLLREFKIDDFLKQATCLQLLCAGEKLNMLSSSKVMLIRYNESVKNLLGVKTILMKY